MSVDPKRRLRRDLANRLLEPMVRERLDPAAVAADQMVVMISARGGRLVVSAVGAKLEPVHEPEPGERLERSIDAGDADSRSTGSHAMVDLLCRQAASLAAKGLDHRRPRPAGLVSRLPQDGLRMLGPVHAAR